MRPHLLVAPVLSLALAACGDPPDEPGFPEVTTGAYHHFVHTGWQIPTTGDEARAGGFDLDGDGSIENQAGSLVSALGSIGLDMVGANLDSFRAGQVVILQSVRADSLVNDRTVSWRVLDGLGAGPPRFDGTDALTVLAEDGLLAGTILQGQLRAEFGAVVVMRIPFFPDQPPLRVPLAGARVELDLAAAGCHGKLGGALLAADLRDRALPQLADQVLLHMARHPTHSFTATARTVFDADHDGVVTAAEFINHSITQSLFTADVDLDGDGAPDGMSFGLGFGCAPASFVVVGE